GLWPARTIPWLDLLECHILYREAYRCLGIASYSSSSGGISPCGTVTRIDRATPGARNQPVLLQLDDHLMHARGRYAKVLADLTFRGAVSVQLPEQVQVSQVLTLLGRETRYCTIGRSSQEVRFVLLSGHRGLLLKESIMTGYSRQAG
ncbi:MAG: hypothetical protein U1E05_00480, partial [Patescibacteria group bacterium]|nr:hypothetical protein [Patescibacteria group bacterium]